MFYPWLKSKIWFWDVMQTYYRILFSRSVENGDRYRRRPFDELKLQRTGFPIPSVACQTRAVAKRGRFSERVLVCWLWSGLCSWQIQVVSSILARVTSRSTVLFSTRTYAASKKHKEAFSISLLFNDYDFVYCSLNFVMHLGLYEPRLARTFQVAHRNVEFRERGWDFFVWYSHLRTSEE